MARGIQLAFTLNPKDFLRGLKVIETDLDDVREALDDVGDAANDALDDLDTRKAERGLKDVGDAADKAARDVDDVADEAKDVERAFSRLGTSARADMAKVERSTKDVERELGDVEDEANQSAKEFGSSFRGDPVEALEEVQSYLSEIISTKLPGLAGAFAAVAGGAALGLIVAGVEKWREKQERINEIARDFYDIILETADGPLQATNRAYDQLLDKTLARKVLEDANIDQMATMAALAAARGETVENYVQNILSGEIDVNEELAAQTRRRNELADQLLENTRDNNAANDDQIPILQKQVEQAEKHRAQLAAMRGWIGENVAAYGKAKQAQENVGKATAASQEKQRGQNKAALDTARSVERIAGEARDVKATVQSTPDLKIKAKVDRSEIDNLPKERTMTLRVGVRGSTAKDQRLLAGGFTL